MKKKWLKKGSAVLLTATMILSLLLGENGTLATVQAAPNDAPTVGYWTDAEGLKYFSLANATDTVGKVIFGQNGSGVAKLWKIAGTDTRIIGDNIILFADTPLETSAFEADGQNNKTFSVDWNCAYPDGTSIADVNPNHYGSSDLRSVLQGYATNSAYFSSAEQGKMNNTTIYTDDTKNIDTNNKSVCYSTTDKLYAPYGSLGDSYVTVGTNASDNLNGGVQIDASKWGNDNFWLRSPHSTNRNNALLAPPGYLVGNYDVDRVDVVISVVPVLNLNLSSDIFASAAEAASSSYSGFKAKSGMTENTYTLRYTYTDGADSAVINPSGTQVKVTGASDKYLMVQNGKGVYALAITSADQTVSASNIQMGSQESDNLENFNNCKVWIESTTDRITTAKMATQTTAPTPSYKIIDGANSTWTASSDGTLSIRGDGEMSKFVSVKVDGALVDAANFTVTSGSTIITFTKEYLNTLSVGSHTFELVWTDGSASTSFTVNATPTETPKTDTAKKDEVPKTEDSTPIAWLFILTVIGGACVVYFGRKKKTVR